MALISNEKEAKALRAYMLEVPFSFSLSDAQIDRGCPSASRSDVLNRVSHSSAPVKTCENEPPRIIGNQGGNEHAESIRADREGRIISQ